MASTAHQDAMDAHDDFEAEQLCDLGQAADVLKNLAADSDDGLVTDAFRAQVNRAVDRLSVALETWDMCHRAPPPPYPGTRPA